ncbi:hypothetical protein GCK72_002978 [Caenorhabditis remanei]|uniref:glucuronosyltransferase n=1 Tax=Caenorhabditis remanei TaxID=31234 RepID=A0A6A5HY94_CAERE|nr:hypothetical protein GCK72_002978 [Caenorhabditis remanei]KAF1771152.1 hypothetical protein GCK72_002978 [Caenorhabditis remanei]
MARLADTLTEAGHNVTFLIPVADEARKRQLGVKLTKDVVLVEQDAEMRRHVKPIDDDMEQFWTTDMDSSNADTIFNMFTESMTLSCENFMRNREVFDQMKSRNFDVGIFEPLSVCGLGFMHALGIDKMIMASSCALYDGTVAAIGEPLDFSYVPGMMSKSGEKMSLFERLENYKMSMASYRMQYNMWDKEISIVQKAYGASIPDWRDLMPASSVFFTNSIPYVDFPRTVTQKTVPIGGISVDMAAIRDHKLSIEWSTVLDERPYNMLISFGSMVRSMDMPIEWRNGLLEAIKSEPNVTFIWKYENDELEWAQGVSNIHFSRWVPQTALLNDDRLSAFMTHGGLGSTNELAHLGKAALMIPVFADQNRNARMLERHGGVKVIEKYELADKHKIRSAIQSILHDKQYKEKAERLAHLLINQPMKPKEQVVKYTEFVARFGPFPQMDSHGRKLSFIQRNLVDVYSIIGFSYLIAFSFVFYVSKFVFDRIPVKFVKKD